MIAPRIFSVVVIASATLAIACSDATGVPLHASYSLELQFDSAQQYGVPECFGSANNYCRGWRPSNEVIQASLDGLASPPQVDLAGKMLAVDSGAFNLDSLPFRLQNVDRAGCIFLTMRVKATGNTLLGTWSEQQDCHGRTARGKFAGARD